VQESHYDTADSIKHVEIVLARCKEDIRWISLFGYERITTVYDKCGSSDGPGRHVQLANTGRESGTYLHHIVNNYDNLAEWSVFTQGEPPTWGYRQDSHGRVQGGGGMMQVNLSTWLCKCPLRQRAVRT
jgi:hypothetical protein